MSDETIIKTPYGICRIERLKGPAGIRQAAAHNLREIETPNADNHAPDLGGGIEVLDGASTSAEILAAEKALLRTHGVTKPRKDAVRGIEMVLSASPHWFDSATDDDKRAWIQAARRFAHAQFPVEGSILSTVVHDDESSLHLQVIGSPLHRKARKKGGRPPKDPEKRARWERRQAAPAEPTVGLDARTLFGSKPRLRRLQDDYAKAMAPFGLARGRPKSLTGAEHRHHDAWKAERIAEAQKSEKRSWAVSEAQEAVVAGYLVHVPDHDDLWPTKRAEKKAKAEGSDLFEPVRTWKAGAGDLWGTVVKFGKRWAELRRREKGVKQRETDVEIRENAITEREDAVAKREDAVAKREPELEKEATTNAATAQGLEQARQKMKNFAAGALGLANIVRPRSEQARKLAKEVQKAAPSWAAETPPEAMAKFLKDAAEAERAAIARAQNRGAR
jgi:hypothetical protein